MTKISIISDGRFAKTESEKEMVLDQFSFVKELGGEIQVVTDNYFTKRPDGSFSSYQDAQHRVEFEGPTVFEYDPAFIESIKDSDVIIAHYSAVNATLMDALPKLKMIGVLRSGVENVELEAANKRNLIVSNSPGRVSEPVADYTVTMILAFHRSISRHDMYHSKKFVREVPVVPCLMREMTVGIVGLGIIGTKVAKRLAGFGCKLLAYDPFMNEERAKALNVEPVSLNELMERSDCITVHARYTEETKNLIGAEQFALMKKDAFIVNTARSRLIDEEAMIKALQEGSIRGAALDVYNDEPLPEDSPFFQMENVLLSPHIAGTAGDWTRLTIAAMQEEMKEYLEGKDLKYQINRNKIQAK